MYLFLYRLSSNYKGEAVQTDLNQGVGKAQAKLLKKLDIFAIP